MINFLKNKSDTNKSVPKKPVSIIEGILYGIGCGFGASVFVLVGQGAILANAGLLVSLLLGSIFILLSALNYSELLTSLPSAGGVYNIGKEGVGGSFAFIIGFFLWISNITISAFSAMVLNDTIVNIFPSLKQYNIILIITLICIIGLISFYAQNLSNKILIGMTIILLGLFVLFIVAAFFAPPPSSTPILNVDPVDLSSFDLFGVIQTFALLFILFKGIMLNLAHLNPNLRNPDKNVPLVNVVAVVASSIIYFLIFEAILVNIEWFSRGILLTTDNLMADVLYRILGNVGASLMYLALVLSTIITISAGLSSATEVFKALVRDGYFSKTLFVKDLRSNKYSVSVILVNIIVGIIFILVIPSTGFTEEIISFIYFFSIAFINFAAVLLRYKRKELDRPFKAPLFPVLPITVGGVCLFLAFILSFQAIILGVFIGILGLLIYLLLIADRYSKIITLSGIKFLSIIVAGFVIWVIKNLGIVTSDMPGGSSLFLDVLLRIMIFFCVFGFLTVFLDFISLREIVNFFVKRFEKEKVVIKIGAGEIIEIKKREKGAIYTVNYVIGIIEILGALFTFVLVYILTIDLIVVLEMDLVVVVLDAQASKYVIISSLLIFGSAFLLRGISRLYYNYETVKLGM
ncbi:MAG: membrane protein of unknown function [Promethearchaeota archaeon]|nr:MAG: membrane protein of unknown function [Candidatus Lokiarchaeota archaeon]